MDWCREKGQSGEGRREGWEGSSAGRRLVLAVVRGAVAAVSAVRAKQLCPVLALEEASFLPFCRLSMHMLHNQQTNMNHIFSTNSMGAGSAREVQKQLTALEAELAKLKVQPA